MNDRMRAGSVIACVLALLVASPAAGAAPTAKQRYVAARAREQALRTTWTRDDGANAQPAPATAKEAHAIIVAYETIVRRHPTSGYCDNALWQAGELAADLFAVSQDLSDRQTAVRLLEFLAREYPTSSLAARAADQARRLQSAAPAHAPNAAKSAEPSPRGRETPPNAVPARRAGSNPASTSARPVTPAVLAEPVGQASLSTIREIRRTVLAEVVRVSIELDREVIFHEERVDNPARLLFDLTSTKASAAVQDANWSYQDDIVRHIRVGRHPNQTTRVVLDLEGVSRHTVVTLYNPYRILIDCERATATKPVPTPAPPATTGVTPQSVPGTVKRPEIVPGAVNPPDGVPGAVKNIAGATAATRPPKKTAPAKVPAPAAEKTDANRVSMARQLGLGVSRIVIDPGHGGRDPGAEGSDISEAQVVLDIALRLEKALARQPGIEVVLTRRSDIFVPLEERTRIANREQADLFLSIHANASRNQNARGIESYYLNFASNPEAEAVAARENAASERTMSSLTDIVKAITLNNKLDESKELAALVQQAMARRLKPSNKSIRNLGVKQAPFVVLIGAAMPSVLAEVSFVTNRREGQLLRTEAYRQRIAEALADGILRYRRTLKTANVASQ
jgi:N-acetylmuramoyl-L-alanine amidase